jgi:hypothetical protein
LNQFINNILQVNVEDDIVANNQTLPDGSDRLVLNSCPVHGPMSGTLNSGF